MKNNNWLLKTASVALIGAVGLIASCKEEERLTVADTQDITEEAVTDSYFQDMDDMSGLAVASSSEAEYDGGRAATTYEISIQDSRFECTEILVTITPEGNADLPKGVITIDFGTEGCQDNKGNVRTGKLVITYNGKRFQQGSTLIIEPVNYMINGIKLEGTRTSTNISGSSLDAPKFNVTLVGGKAIFPDQTFATRASDITWTWVRAASPVDDQLIIDPASAEGTTRGGRAYTVTVLEALKYKRFCGGIAADGIKQYVIDGSKQITIDYGDGTCDKSVTITVNGVTRNITVN